MPETKRRACTREDTGLADEDSAADTELMPRILVVDDNPTIHQDFRKILDRRPEPSSELLRELEARFFGEMTHPPPPPGFDLDFAYQGKEGLDKVIEAKRSEQPYALVFVDVRMPPGWNGVETASHLIREDPDLHVVLCTAYSDYGWEEIMSIIGETDRVLILKKPFHPLEVRQLAHTLATKWQLARLNKRRLADLEERVAERTRDLEAANEQLRREMAERIRAESELRKAQRLEALGRLTAGIGHEINNPLSFIMASIEAMQADLGDYQASLPEHIHEEFGELLQAAWIGADRIAQIIRNIRLFGRPSNAPAELVDVSQALSLCARMVECEIDTRVIISLDLVVVPPVIGRRVEIEQIFINLLKNAAHALAEVPTEQPEIRATSRCEDDGTVIAEIADNGPGIDEALMDKIFDPFFTTKSVDKGSGLGLSICHAIIKGLGGDITIHSAKGEGTVVTVRLPPAPQAMSQPRRARTDAPRDVATERAGRILVVDDEPLILRAVERALRGHHVVAVSGGREALGLCMSEPFDLVVCDIMMSGINGRDFYQMLRQAQPGAERSILFITGGALIDEVKDFLAGVPNPCIEKPFETADFRQTIERLLAARAEDPLS